LQGVLKKVVIHFAEGIDRSANSYTSSECTSTRGRQSIVFQSHNALSL